MLQQHDLNLPWQLIANDRALAEAAHALSAGEGHFGVDAERASGFRYDDSAYLVQVARRGAGTFLIDPTGITDFSGLAAAMNPGVWILHAASQDLPCLAELGLHPAKLLDTEQGARLLNLPRVNLGALTETFLGIQLEKAHSAQDWSTRPLPDDWLEYAAFDAAVLPALWEAVEAELSKKHKLEAALQEFEHQRTKPPKPPHPQPWRRLKGIHALQGSRQLAIARALWEARDEFAQSINLSPGRVLPDRSIVAAAAANPRSANDLARLKEFHGRYSRRELPRWWRAVKAGKNAQSVPPPQRRETDSVPSRSAWSQKRPDALVRYRAARQALVALGEQLNLPTEALLEPKTLQRLAWEPPAEPGVDAMTEHLAELGARPWQVARVANPLTDAFVDAAQTDDPKL